MIKWAGWIITLGGIGHTLGALTFEGAAGHADAWFSGALRHEDFGEMSAAGSAYWFSLSSFGPTTIVLGVTILWLARRGVTPPTFIAWTLLALTAIDAIVLTFTPWILTVVASALLLVGARRARQRDELATMTPSGDVEPRPQSRQPA